MKDLFQKYVAKWCVLCFGQEIALSKEERTLRFLEEALELVQAGGLPKEAIAKMVDRVYSRPVGDIKQEAGGVGVTLAAWCHAHDIEMELCFIDELDRIHKPDVMKAIQDKHKSKPLKAKMTKTQVANRMMEHFKKAREDAVDG